MLGSLIGRSGNSRSIRSSVVLFLGPHPFLSAIARISPLQTTDVKEIASELPRWKRVYVQRAQSASRVSPSSMFVSSRKRRMVSV